MAVKLDPDNTEYKMNLADVYMQTGEIDEAIRLYQVVSEKRPDNVEASLALARLSSETGLNDAALFYFSKVLEIEPDNAEALRFMSANASKGVGKTLETITNTL